MAAKTRVANARRKLVNVKRLVVKVGTFNLVDERYRLDVRKVGKVVKEIMDARADGKEVILVTSGAIGAGIGRMNLEGWPRKMAFLQAAASIGQAVLMEVYERDFAMYNQPVAQILLTWEDFKNKERLKNFKNTVNTLLEWGVIPIINENDTVAVEEIKVGDNDFLSALTAMNVDADLLLILSDVDGLYTGDPKRDKNAKLIKTVRRITPKIERMAGGTSTGFGGMLTKVQASKMVVEHGIPSIIANGDVENIIQRVLAGEEIGTIFLPKRAGT
jgi:glutamate 5-kinase